MPLLRLALLGSLLTLPALAQPVPMSAQGCLGCHGPGGQGVGSIPGIAGRPAEELRAQMAAFRANQLPATIMGRIARGYSEAETAAIAAHFARQPAR